MDDNPEFDDRYKGKFRNHPIHRHYLLTETRDHDIIIFQEQYRALRQEILQRQQRRFLIVVGGALGVPGLSGLSMNNAISGDVVLVAPLIIIVISYLFALENYSIARAGYFIEESVENSFKTVPGWEHYLHDLSNYKLKNSPAARGSQGAFTLLMVAYFLASYVAASGRIFDKYQQFSGVWFLLYSLFAIGAFAHWMYTIRPSLSFSSQLLKNKSGRSE